MGCDIHPRVEVRIDDTWTYLPDFLVWDVRNYGLYGFLADVRNYSESPVITPPRGLPDDVSPVLAEEHGTENWYHSTSWLTLAELLAYDYEQVFWDRRIERVTSVHPSGGRVIDGAARAEEGEGEHLSLREFLGEWYFRELERLGELGAPEDVRVVFWFDS